MLTLAVLAASGALPATGLAGGLLDAFLPPGVGDAQNRCMTYGFKGQNALARCTEVEMDYAKPKRWKLSEISAAEDRCMIFGFRGDKLAGCIQRQLRKMP